MFRFHNWRSPFRGIDISQRGGAIHGGARKFLHNDRSGPPPTPQAPRHWLLGAETRVLFCRTTDVNFYFKRPHPVISLISGRHSLHVNSAVDLLRTRLGMNLVSVAASKPYVRPLRLVEKNAFLFSFFQNGLFLQRTAPRENLGGLWRFSSLKECEYVPPGRASFFKEIIAKSNKEIWASSPISQLCHSRPRSVIKSKTRFGPFSIFAISAWSS